MKQLIYLKVLCLKIEGIYKKVALIFSLSKTGFFLLLLFSIYKMADIMGIYKSLNVIIGTVMKNPKMLEFVPDHLKI